MVHHDEFRRYIQHDRFTFIQGGRLDVQARNITLGVEHSCLGVPHGFHSKGLLPASILLWPPDLTIRYELSKLQSTNQVRIFTSYGICLNTIPARSKVAEASRDCSP